MKNIIHLMGALAISALIVSCVSNKKFSGVQGELAASKAELAKSSSSLNEYKQRTSTDEANIKSMTNQIEALKDQLGDCKEQRNKQLEQVGGLTVLSQSANENIKETLAQLERKDKYIHLLQAAKTKADSLNLALAVNLTAVLKDGIADKDIEVKVDKTVVFVNLSDKMLFKSGSYKLTPRANEVLGKIATIIQSRQGFEVMVEGYTDNVPIKNSVLDDNWDLSVKRATSVVRSLQSEHNVDPNRLIAAGRGEYNTLTSNDSEEGKAINRRTRIIIMPKLDEFFDLLNPSNVPQ